MSSLVNIVLGCAGCSIVASALVLALFHGAKKIAGRDGYDDDEPDVRTEPEPVEHTATPVPAPLADRRPDIVIHDRLPDEPVDCDDDCPCVERAKALLAEVNRVQQDPLLDVPLQRGPGERGGLPFGFAIYPRQPEGRS